MIKPDAYRHMGKILHAIYKSGFIVKSVRGLAWVAQFYSMPEACSMQPQQQ
jgi:hypothetical protein